MWFQDEARFGQQGTLTAVWAIKGSRPTGVRQSGRKSIWVFAAEAFTVTVAAANGTGGFANAVGNGTFSAAQSGNDLKLVYTPGAPTNDIVIDAPTGSQTQAPAGHPLITAADSVTKIGAGTVVFDAANTYTGPTTISAGTLQVANADALATTGVTVAAGGTRAVGYIVDGAGARVSFAAPGDTNLDGVVDLLDLLEILGSGTYEAPVPAVCSQGDFNYDGVSNLFDLLAILGSGAYDQGNCFPAAATGGAGLAGYVAAVPEPGTLGLVAAAGLAALALARRRRSR